GAVLNCLLDPWFIFGLGWGVKGAAWATVISQAVSAFWVIAFLRGKRTNWKLQKAYLRPVKSILKPVLALGAAPFVLRSTDALLSLRFNTPLQHYGGDLAVGAMTILSTIRQMVFLPLSGLARASQPIISFNYGAKNYQRIQRAFRLVLQISILVSVICWLVIMLSPGFLIKIFTSDPVLQAKSIWAIRIYLAGLFILGIQMACQQTFISLGQAKQGLIMAVWRKLVLLIPLIYILPYFMEDKVFAVLVAEPIADIIATCTTFTLFCLTTRKLYRQ
ncbi:MAG: polysaccharide biosynthesis C-terminal domain-containing protein, partial [Clostridia bacterium]|nr:polysaccharide biosynthesis C-terminal domain-containing protein [Clostridia bacterium]